MSDAVACSFWSLYLRSDPVGRLELAKRIAEVIYPCVQVSDRSTAVLCLSEYLRTYFDDLLRCSEYLWQRRSASEPRTEPPANER